MKIPRKKEKVLELNWTEIPLKPSFLSWHSMTFCSFPLSFFPRSSQPKTHFQRTKKEKERKTRPENLLEPRLVNICRTYLGIYRLVYFQHSSSQLLKQYQFQIFWRRKIWPSPSNWARKKNIFSPEKKEQRMRLHAYARIWVVRFFMLICFIFWVKFSSIVCAESSLLLEYWIATNKGNNFSLLFKIPFHFSSVLWGMVHVYTYRSIKWIYRLTFDLVNWPITLQCVLVVVLVAGFSLLERKEEKQKEWNASCNF